MCICLTLATSALLSTDDKHSFSGKLPCQRKHNNQIFTAAGLADLGRGHTVPPHNQHRHEIPFYAEQHARFCRPVGRSSRSSSHSTDLGQTLPVQYVYEQLSVSNKDSIKDSNVVGQKHIPCWDHQNALCHFPEQHIHNNVHSCDVMKASE